MKPLNIILITSHDIGRHLGCYGIAGTFSPNLDKFAEESVLFEQAFCSQSQCSPSRASIYTGRYPHSNGVMGLTHSVFQWDLYPDEKHLAGILQSKGYRTALAGLQHETSRTDEMGFDIIEWNEPGQLAPGTSEIANGILAKFAETPEQPFYLQVGFFEPHRRPYHENHDWGPMPADDVNQVKVPEYLEDNPGTRDEIAQMQGAIKYMDEAFGNIMSKVDELGMKENTIVIFTADHGIPFPRAKTSLYEPGLEVALIMRGPWQPLRTSQLIPNVDILPTLLELVDIPVADNVQGKSFAPLLNGEKYTPNKYVFGEMTYHNYCDPMRSVRNDSHKIIVNFMPCANIYNSTQQWAPVTVPAVPKNPKGTPHVVLELYDLVNDSLEFNNLADQAEVAEIQAELLKQLHQWMVETEDPLLEGIPQPQRFKDAVALIKNS